MRKSIAILAAMFLLFAGGLFSPAAAQSGDRVLILTYLCDTHHDNAGAGFLPMPEDCVEAGGVRIVVYDESGAYFSECTTNDRGACSVQAPLGETITIEEDVSTLSDGYAPARNPIVEDTDPNGASGEWIREFINAASGDTVTLPNTGSGNSAHSDRNLGMPVMATLGLLLCAAAYALRRGTLSSRDA